VIVLSSGVYGVGDVKSKRVDWNESANFGVLLDSIVILEGNRHDCRKSCGSKQVDISKQMVHNEEEVEDSLDIRFDSSCPKSEPTPNYISQIIGTSLFGLRLTAHPSRPKQVPLISARSIVHHRTSLQEPRRTSIHIGAVQELNEKMRRKEIVLVVAATYIARLSIRHRLENQPVNNPSSDYVRRASQQYVLACSRRREEEEQLQRIDNKL